MENPMIEYKSEAHHLRGFTTGLLLGGLASAVAILLIAPQSGEKTRAKILNKGKELREQTVQTVEDSKTKARQITADIRDKAEKLQHRGQKVLDQQKERLSAVVESGNAVVQNYLD